MPTGRPGVRITPSGGKKPDKLITDALRIELMVEAKDCNGVPTRKLRLLARALIDRAIEHDTSAAREVLDRVEGKVPLTAGDGEGALVVRIIRFSETEAPALEQIELQPVKH